MKKKSNAVEIEMSSWEGCTAFAHPAMLCWRWWWYAGQKLAVIQTSNLAQFNIDILANIHNLFNISSKTWFFKHLNIILRNIFQFRFNFLWELPGFVIWKWVFILSPRSYTFIFPRFKQSTCDFSITFSPIKYKWTWNEMESVQPCAIAHVTVILDCPKRSICGYCDQLSSILSVRLNHKIISLLSEPCIILDWKCLIQRVNWLKCLCDYV